MAIPRLAPSADPIDVTITVNVKLRPYFEIWFQREKLAGETPKQFALRMLKNAAMNDYLRDTAKTEVDAVEQAKIDSLNALQADANSLSTEVD